MTADWVLLIENNPFYVSAASDPWEMRFPDIASINKSAYDGICKLVKLKAKHPSDQMAILVHGEAGTGKTHMIGRIMQQTSISEDGSFAYIRPIISQDAPLRHLLKGIVTSLAHDVPECHGLTQFHRLITMVLSDYILKEGEGSYERINAASKDPWHFFRQIHCGKAVFEVLQDEVLSWLRREVQLEAPHLLTALFQIPDLKKKGIVVRWLSGDVIDDEEAQLVHLPSRYEKSDSGCEADASELLISLGRLITRYNKTVLICFDQLDNLKEPELIDAFGLMIQTLVNDCSGLLPIAFVRSTSWYEVIRTKIDPSSVGKLEQNIFSLAGCNREESYEIIKSRIKFVIPDLWKRSVQAVWDEISLTLPPIATPREVISLANRAVQRHTTSTEFIPFTPLDILQKSYRSEIDLILSDLDSWPPDRDQVLVALEVALSEYHLVRSSLKGKKRHPYLEGKVTCPSGQTHQVVILINMIMNHSTVGGFFNQGSILLERDPGLLCIYYTDPRCIVTKSTWAATNEKRDRFEADGGRIIQPSTIEIARVYALYSLICKVTEGDLLVQDNNGVTRAVKREELDRFVRDRDLFGSPILSLCETNFTSKISNELPDSEIIFKSICEVLKGAAMHLMSTQVIHRQVVQKGFIITQEQLLEICGKRKDIFRVYRNPQGSMIMLYGEGVVCKRLP